MTSPLRDVSDAALTKMIGSHAPRAMDGPRSDAPIEGREPWRRRIRNWLWGFDFFISYDWDSGGIYAFSLAEGLRRKGFDCFLDRTEFAQGDNWVREVRRALSNTQRLIVVATREAVADSVPVAKEVQIFASRSRHIVPVIFADPGQQPFTGGQTLTALQREKSVPLSLIPDTTLQIREPIVRLNQGASDEAIEKLVCTHGILRRRMLRVRIVLATISLIACAALIAALLAVLAVQRGDRIADQVVELRGSLARHYLDRAIDRLEDRDYNQGLSLLWKAYDTTQADDAMRPSLRQLLSYWERSSPLVCRTSPSLVDAVAFSADGKSLLTAHSSALGAFKKPFAQVWDAETGQLIGRKAEHPFRLSAIAFRPHSQTFATGCQDGNVRLWNPQTGEQLEEWLVNDDRSSVTLLVFDPSGARVLTSDLNSRLQIWDVKSHRRVAGPFVHQNASCAAFAPDGTRLLTGSLNGIVHLWDGTTGEPLGAFVRNNEDPAEGAIISVAYSADGQEVFTVDHTGRVDVWQADTLGRSTRDLILGDIAHDAVPVTDGLLVLANVGNTFIWDSVSESLVGPSLWPGDIELYLDSPTDKAAVALNPRGRSAAVRTSASTLLRTRTVDQLSQPAVVQIHRLPDVTRLFLNEEHGSDAPQIRFDADGGSLVTINNRELVHFDAHSGESFGEPVPVPEDVLAWSGDGAVLAVGEEGDERTVIVLDSTSGEVKARLPHERRITAAAFGSIEPATLLIADEAGAIWQHDLIRRTTKQLHKFDESLQRLEFGPNDKLLFMVSLSGRAQLLNLLNPGTPILKVSVSDVGPVAFAHNDTLIAIGDDQGSVQLRDTVTGELLGNPFIHPTEVTSLAMCDNVLAIGGQQGTIRLWNIITGAPLGRPFELAFKDSVTGLAYHPTGNRLAVAVKGRKNTVWMWRLPETAGQTPNDDRRLKREIERRTGWRWSDTGEIKGARMEPVPPDR